MNVAALIGLQDARERAGLTRAELAVALGRTEQSVAGWELGKHTPPRDVVVKLSRLLGVEMRELRGLDNRREVRGQFMVAAMEGARETRNVQVAPLEVRSAAGGMVVVRGYASTFNQRYDVGGRWTEVVMPGAFDVTLKKKADVVLQVNHEGLPLARTKSGTLKLSTDSHGLLMDATLNPSDPDAARLLPKLERGDVDEMSIGFFTKRDKWVDDVRQLLELSLHKGDVSVVTFGSNEHTSVAANGEPARRRAATPRQDALRKQVEKDRAWREEQDRKLAATLKGLRK
jgi:HK97 family phage prohead protease